MARQMKMYPKKTKGYTTGYFILLGCKEARDAGFVNDDGTTVELKKTVDATGKRIIIEIDEKQE